MIPACLLVMLKGGEDPDPGIKSAYVFIYGRVPGLPCINILFLDLFCVILFLRRKKISCFFNSDRQVGPGRWGGPCALDAGFEKFMTRCSDTTVIRSKLL